MLRFHVKSADFEPSNQSDTPSFSLCISTPQMCLTDTHYRHALVIDPSQGMEFHTESTLMCHVMPTLRLLRGHTVSGTCSFTRCSTSFGSSRQCTPWSTRRMCRCSNASQMNAGGPSSPNCQSHRDISEEFCVFCTLFTL